MSPRGDTFTLSPATWASSWCGEWAAAGGRSFVAVGPLPEGLSPKDAALLLRDALVDFQDKRRDPEAHARSKFHPDAAVDAVTFAAKVAEIARRVAHSEALRELLFEFRIVK